MDISPLEKSFIEQRDTFIQLAEDGEKDIFNFSTFCGFCAISVAIEAATAKHEEDRRLKGFDSLITRVLMFEVVACFLSGIKDMIAKSPTIPDKATQGVLTEQLAEVVKMIGENMEEVGPLHNATSILLDRIKAYPFNPPDRVSYLLSVLNSDRHLSQPVGNVKNVPPLGDISFPCLVQQFYDLVITPLTLRVHDYLEYKHKNRADKGFVRDMGNMFPGNFWN